MEIGDIVEGSTGIKIWGVQTWEGGKPCKVCELDVKWRDQGSDRSWQPEESQNRWIFVPTSRELLHICLNCGNTLRERRME